MFLIPLHVLLGELSVQGLCPFLNWVASLLRMESCEFFIYFGDKTLVCGIFGKYVFPYCWFSFHFQVAFYFDEVPFVYSFLYVSCSKGHISENIAAWNIFEILLPMFSSRTLMVSRLIFKSFVHLEFIFLYGVSWGSSLIFFHVAVQFSQYHLLKRLFLLYFMLLPPLSNIN